MATLTEKIQCERDAREMLKRSGLPEPDRVEYGYTCIRLFWEEPKLVLVVDIDEPPPDFEVVGEYLEDLEDLKAFGLDADDEDPDDPDLEDAVEELRRSFAADDDEEEAA
jgi:hypothetical protein